jgi:hypothetical protein
MDEPGTLWPMSRRLLVLTWLLATAAPALLAIVLIGCCALPLHGMVHSILPLCETAESVLAGQGHDGQEHEHRAPAPRQKQDQQEGPRLAWKTVPRVGVVSLPAAVALHELPLDVARRSQSAPSAFRCDDDVGTRLALLDTLRI